MSSVHHIDRMNHFVLGTSSPGGQSVADTSASPPLGDRRLSALALTAVAACGGNDGSGGGGDSAGSADKADLTWSFWVGGTEDPGGLAEGRRPGDHRPRRHRRQAPGHRLEQLLVQDRHPAGQWQGTLHHRHAEPADRVVRESAMLPLDDLMSKYGLKTEDFDRPIMDGLKVDKKQIAIPARLRPDGDLLQPRPVQGRRCGRAEAGLDDGRVQGAKKRSPAARKSGLVTTPATWASRPGCGP